MKTARRMQYECAKEFMIYDDIHLCSYNAIIKRNTDDILRIMLDYILYFPLYTVHI